MKTVPISQKEANDFVNNLHRHHKSVRGDKFRVGAYHEGKIVGVVQVGRPVNRYLDDGKTLEVVRLCTDGTRNACTFLYGKACQIAKLMGYTRVITYILDSEPGTSLIASGFVYDHNTIGREWTCKSRPRKKSVCTQDKKCYVRLLK